jgi:hypothetical protein
MRERHEVVSVPVKKPILEAVRSQFQAWRKRRHCRGPIPESLWQAAVGLCREHSICEVSRALRLNYSRLKDQVTPAEGRGRTRGQHPDLGFVRLDFGAPMPASECQVEMEAPNGARMMSM